MILHARIDPVTGEMFAFSFSPLPFQPGQDSVPIGDFSTPPNRRTKRYDGSGGIRDATAQEIADFDTARKDEEAVREIDELKALKALALVLADEVAKTPAQIRDAFILKYKSLP